MKKILENYKKNLGDQPNKVAKVVIFDGSKVLLLKRTNYHKKFANHWDLPGGHAKENEKLEKALSREVDEETALSLISPRFVFSDDGHYFFVDKFSKEKIKLSKEHSKFMFTNINNIEKLDLFTDKYKKAVFKAYKVKNDKF